MEGRDLSVEGRIWPDCPRKGVAGRRRRRGGGRRMMRGRGFCSLKPCCDICELNHNRVSFYDDTEPDCRLALEPCQLQCIEGRYLLQPGQGRGSIKKSSAAAAQANPSFPIQLPPPDTKPWSSPPRSRIPEDGEIEQDRAVAGNVVRR